MANTFYNFKLDLDPNAIDMIYDLLRMSTIQLITQIMFYMNNSSLSLFNETFIKTFIFINISIIFYYLVVRKIFSFVSDDYLNVSNKDYHSTPPIKSSVSSHPAPKAVASPSPVPSQHPPSPPINKTQTETNISNVTGSTSINNI
jgi:hypothetical protein